MDTFYEAIHFVLNIFWNKVLCTRWKTGNSFVFSNEYEYVLPTNL